MKLLILAFFISAVTLAGQAQALPIAKDPLANHNGRAEKHRKHRRWNFLHFRKHHGHNQEHKGGHHHLSRK